MPLTPEEEKRILDLATLIYVAGYTDGMVLVADEYGLRSAIPGAGARMEGPLEIRMDLVSQAIDGYVKLIEKKAAELAAKGLSGEILMHEVTSYARQLADNKAQVIAQMEFAQAKLDGAGNVLDESGLKYQWRFPHFNTGRPGHEVCDICEAIAAGSPYTAEEAEEEGFPEVAHPNCDHGWVVVPLGERTLTEQFNAG